MLMSREPRLAEEFIREKEQMNIESRRSRKARLEKPLSVQSASSNVVDMINCLRRINSQLTSLAYAIVRDSTRSGETTVLAPELEEAWPAEDSANKKQSSPRYKTDNCEVFPSKRSRRSGYGFPPQKGDTVNIHPNR
jgi:hypothetical protein